MDSKLRTCEIDIGYVHVCKVAFMNERTWTSEWIRCNVNDDREQTDAFARVRCYFPAER